MSDGVSSFGFVPVVVSGAGAEVDVFAGEAECGFSYVCAVLCVFGAGSDVDTGGDGLAGFERGVVFDWGDVAGVSFRGVSGLAFVIGVWGGEAECWGDARSSCVRLFGWLWFFGVTGLLLSWRGRRRRRCRRRVSWGLRHRWVRWRSL